MFDDITLQHIVKSYIKGRLFSMSAWISDCFVIYWIFPTTALLSKNGFSKVFLSKVMCPCVSNIPDYSETWIVFSSLYRDVVADKLNNKD